jgi:hypothetical protein
MTEHYGKRQVYEFCRTREMMVRLDVIKSRLRMPDMVETEMVLVPVGCNRQEDCKLRGLKCLVYDKDHGIDPCPDAWNSESDPGA